jgi:hypothetical protein
MSAYHDNMCRPDDMTFYVDRSDGVGEIPYLAETLGRLKTLLGLENGRWNANNTPKAYLPARWSVWYLRNGRRYLA